MIPLQDATSDIELPRRSLLVEFTCDECGETVKEQGGSSIDWPINADLFM
ncbi:hypothetical protein SLEP1_g47113 [Rubroshorea leprosula]|uniref:Uncharacterized protein n=1 Tax=Rubroshorea leprosula TaxID=152421 RepID=A0AAV5LRL1_9ROSI|nr:hypothetical protein SLEP1_g47113 [Rubroshorea leprosula]